jgi:hypothetical protein
MAELLKVTLRDQGSVIFEVDGDDRGVRQVGKRETQVRELSSSLEDRLSGIHDAAMAALAELRGKLEPDEIRLKFGIKMTAEVGAVIARTALEGNLDVEMVWKARAELAGGAQPDDGALAEAASP